MRDRIHLRTFAAGCCFTLCVFAATSLAANFQPVDGPSDHDRIIAQGKRIDRLQVKLARTSETANTAADDAANALSLTNCITGGVGLAENFDGTIVDAKAAGDNPIDSFVLPTLSDDCVSETA